MAKKATAKSYKLPSSKGREVRIKKCPCAKPVVTKAFTAEPFTGLCCAECLEVISYDLINNEKNQSEQVGNNDNAGSGHNSQGVGQEHRSTDDFEDGGGSDISPFI